MRYSVIVPMWYAGGNHRTIEAARRAAKRRIRQGQRHSGGPPARGCIIDAETGRTVEFVSIP